MRPTPTGRGRRTDPTSRRTLNGCIGYAASGLFAPNDCSKLLSHRLGRSIRGREGDTLVDEAESWAEKQGMRDMARFARLNVPGFVDP